MKICVDCQAKKRPTDFNVDRSTPDGLCRRCRACSGRFQKAWREKNLEKARKTKRAWRLKNLAKCRERNRRYMRGNRIKAREWNRLDRERHPERLKKYFKSYYQRNGEAIRARMKETREKYPDLEAGRQTKKRYGIDLVGYKELLRKQGERCAICRRADPGVPGRKRLFVDHNHATFEIRGLLCYRCNTGCGNFKDSSRILELAARYLETPPNHAHVRTGGH